MLYVSEKQTEKLASQFRSHENSKAILNLIKNKIIPTQNR